MTSTPATPQASWRGVLEEYRARMPIDQTTTVITLREGGTPLVPAPVLSERTGCDVWLKVEGSNPTGSFKDRGMTVAITKAVEEGSRAVICASTGNTSASAAAYAARAGIVCAVLVPSGKIALGKLAQALVHGAQLLQVDGNFDDCLDLARDLSKNYPVTLVNSVNPYRIEGQKSAAFEICDVLGEAPDVHCLPVGNAGNITAYWKGYREYHADGVIPALPVMRGFQAAGAAPLVSGKPVATPMTIATAIRIGNPASWNEAIHARDESRGAIESVTDRQILDAYRLLARREAVFVEPASAASVAGLLQAQRRRLPRPGTARCVHRHGPRPQGPRVGDLRGAGADDGSRRRARGGGGARVGVTEESVARGYLQLLREEHDFRRVYISQIISLGGDWFALIPLLTLLGRLTDGGLWGGLVLAVDTAVFALLAPYAGTVADRFDRRRTMVIADFASAALVLLLLLVRSESTAWVALVAIGGVAVAKAFFTPASSAALPNIVPPADLARATVLGGAVWGTMLAVGAAAGGVLALLVGARWCFALDAVSFLVSGLLVMRTTRPFSEARQTVTKISVRADVRETYEYARGEPRVRALLACKLGVALGNGTLALFPLYATHVFSVGDVGTGLLYSARGLGALVGPFFMRRYVTRDPALLWPVLATSIGLFGVSYIGFAAAPFFALGLIAVALAHFGGGANWVLSTYGLQSTVPDHVRGRVFSADYMLATLAVSVSQIVAGVLSESVAVRTISAGLGCVVLSYAVVWWVFVRGVRRSGRLAVPDAADHTHPAGPAESLENRPEGA